MVIKMTKQKLSLENVSVIRTTDGWHYDNDIINVSERTFEGRAHLLITYANGESVAVRAADVDLIRYHERKESKLKTQKDVLDAWKEGKLVEVD